MTPSESKQKMERMALDVTKDLALQTPKEVLTPEQIVLERCMTMQQAAAFKFKDTIKQRSIPFTKNEFIEEFYKVLRQEHNTLSKDELAVVACMLLAIMAIKQVRDELI